MLAAFMGNHDISDTVRLAVFAVAFGAVVLLAQLIKAVASYVRINAALQSFPTAPGGDPVLGHVIPLLKAPKKGMGAWDLMESWAKAKGPIVRFRVLGTQGLVVSDPMMLKRIFQTRFKIYAKDLTMSYHPFMPILGTGLVTADGDLWQKQRMLMGPALRIDILDDIVGIAQRCADRLADKLEQYRCVCWLISSSDPLRCIGIFKSPRTWFTAWVTSASLGRALSSHEIYNSSRSFSLLDQHSYLLLCSTPPLQGLLRCADPCVLQGHW